MRAVGERMRARRGAVLFLASLGWASRASAQSAAATASPYSPSAALTTVSGQPYAPYPTYPALPPSVVRYEPGTPPPPGYHLEENPRKGLILAGALTFGVPYLVSLTVGGASSYPADRWLLVPVLGPIVPLTHGMRGCDRDTDPSRCAGNILIVVGLAFDLAAQVAGATLFTMGYVFPKKQWVSDYDSAERAAPAVTWSILPSIDGEGRVGVLVTAR